MRSLVPRITLASLVTSLALGGAVLGAGVGCKSGVGERCQVNADCEGDLVCVPGTDTCAERVDVTADGGIDAPLDAPEVDAEPAVDAAIDADEPDAAVDAAPDA